MKRNRAKDRRRADASGAARQDEPGRSGEIVPWEGGGVAGPSDGPSDGGELLTRRYDREWAPPGSQPSGPKVVRLRRSVLLTMVCLLIVAALAIAGLVRYLPARTANADAGAKASPSATASSGQPSPTGTPPSPATSASGGTGSASPGATGSPTAGASTPIADLSALTPVEQSSVSGPSTGPQQIGSTTYENSVRFTCYSDGGSSGDLIYDVAGYKFLDTMIGIPSDASNAAGNAMTITFYKDGSTTQLSAPVTVTLDHPQTVHLNLQGSSQLEISCNSINTTSQSSAYMDVALANATIGPG
jgi:hypothetical protein